MKTTKQLYKDNLLNNIIPFGRAFLGPRMAAISLFGREGKVYDTDKLMWPQGDKLDVLLPYTTVEQRGKLVENWLKVV